MIVILHNIRSLYNVGSIFRTADAVGVEKIYLCGYTPSPKDKFGKYIPQLSKVALGAEKSMKWEKVKSIAAIVKKLKKEKYRIFAIEQNKKSIPYYKIKTGNTMTCHSERRVAIILGNEVNGISSSILRLADKILEIPMAGKKESLNVSVAFGVVAFRLKYC